MEGLVILTKDSRQTPVSNLQHAKVTLPALGADGFVRLKVTQSN